jgi:hypothetical protein
MSEPSAAQPRVVVLTLSYKLSRRVQSYIDDLTNAGVQVDLLVVENRTLEGTEFGPLVNARPVFKSEMYGMPLRWVERKLVFDVPTKVFGKTRAITRQGERLRLLDRTALAVRRRQSRVSKGIHNKIFWPVFKQARPLLLIPRSRKQALTFDIGNADRIVAADAAALPLAWRIAKRYPNVQATKALDRKPWIA